MRRAIHVGRTRKARARHRRAHSPKRTRSHRRAHNRWRQVRASDTSSAYSNYDDSGHGGPHWRGLSLTPAVRLVTASPVCSGSLGYGKRCARLGVSNRREETPSDGARRLLREPRHTWAIGVFPKTAMVVQARWLITNVSDHSSGGERGTNGLRSIHAWVNEAADQTLHYSCQTARKRRSVVAL
jgi:hypothetical protein